MAHYVLFLQFYLGLLIVTGVDSSCPVELSPPRAVVKYGDPVSVNCSTSENHDGLGWEVPYGGTGAENVNHLLWTMDSLTEWTISPKCFLNPTDNDQCSKVLEVVVYTFPEEISIRSNSDIEGVMTEGKEYVFSCDLPRVAPVKNLTVLWYKNNKTIHREAFDLPNKEPTNLSAQHVFIPNRRDNGVFRCESHMDLGPEGPQLSTSSKEYEVKIYFAPEIQCTTIELLEEETLEGKCNVTGNPPPVLTWKKDELHINQSIPLRRENAGMYTLQAEGNVLIKKDIRVLVMYEPQLVCPSTYTALEDTTHNLTCTVEGFPRPAVIWFKDGEEVELPEKLTRSDAGQYLITASNNLSSMNVTVDITVLYPPSEIVELEDSEVNAGYTVWLKCSSMGNPRPEYRWTFYHTDNVHEENEDGVSRLLIKNTTAINMGSYTCHAWNNMGNVTKTVRVTVKGAKPECPITINPKTMAIQYQSGERNATCEADSSSNVQKIYWNSTNGAISNKTWFADSYNDWDANPVCTATFKGIGTCSKRLNFTLYKPPDSVSIYHVDNSSSVVEDRVFQLQCNIINVAPAQNLIVEWYRGNETIDTDSERTTVCGEDNNSDCSSIRSPVNVLSTINITLNRNQSRAEFSCVARLNLGSDQLKPPPFNSNALNISVFYKPSINTTKLPDTVPVFTGYTISLICEADGHPPPEIKWSYSSSKAHIVGEGEGRLSVSEEGNYTCTATNEVDSTSHMVKVILEVDYLPLIAGFVAVAVVAISIIFLCIFSVYYKNTKMRRYSLKNPKMSAQNGHVAHNGWDTQFPMSKLP